MKPFYEENQHHEPNLKLFGLWFYLSFDSDSIFWSDSCSQYLFGFKIPDQNFKLNQGRGKYIQPKPKVKQEPRPKTRNQSDILKLNKI